MKSRVDFVSRSTGRAYLKTMLHAPSEGLSAGTAFKIRRKLLRAARELEDVISKDVGKTVHVRLTMDSYEACVFWYLVMFRPFYVERDPVLGSIAWNAFELIHDPTRQYILKRLDWGVFWDEKRNWLVLVWEEALTGVLQKLRECPSWDAIVTKEEKRLRKRLDWTWWRLCAESFSHVVPRWQLRNMAYMSNALWHRPGMRYEDVTVLDVAGLDVPRFEVGEEVSAVLPVAKKAHFAHHYVQEEEKRTYIESILQFEKEEIQQRRRAVRGALDESDNRKRNERRRIKRAKRRKSAQFRLARNLTYLAKALGKGYRHGRPPIQISAHECEKRFEHSVDAFVQGELLRSNWSQVERLLDELEELLEELEGTSLAVARRWLLWRNKGKPGIFAYIEHRRRQFDAYQSMVQAEAPQKQEELVELIEHLYTHGD